MSDLRVGIDLGGTKIEVAVLGADGGVVSRRRVATPRSYGETLAALAQLIAAADQEFGVCPVGIGMPGTHSPETNRVKNANSTWLNGKPLAQDLVARVGREIRFENDANCFALSEATDGNASHGRVVFGVIIGTGTGGGLVVDRRVIRGRNAIGGEWGHNPMPWMVEDEWPGIPCYCGRRGCIETFLCGSALARDYAAASGDRQPAEEVARRATAGEALAVTVLERYEDRMARALASVINLVDPDVIVLGGGLSQIARLYTTVPGRWGAYVFSDTVTTELVPPRFGDASGVRGAAWL